MHGQVKNFQHFLEIYVIIKVLKNYFLIFLVILVQKNNCINWLNLWRGILKKEKSKHVSTFKRAWEILDEAYCDDDRLLEILLNDLEQLNTYEVSKGKYDLKIMERFVESLQNFVSQVETIEMGKDLNGRMLLTQVRRKLPEEHRIQFLQSVSEGKTNDSLQVESSGYTSI